jgi:hypothetical protein
MTTPTIPHSQKRLDAGNIPGPKTAPQVIEVMLFWQTAAGRFYRTAASGSYTGTFAVTVAVANNIFSPIASGFTTNLASLQPTGYLLHHLTIRDMTAATNPIVASTAAAVAGSSASPAMPQNVALVLTEQVNVRGRGAKGRMYIPNWATNADAGAGVATAATQTALNAFGTALFNALTGAALTPCVPKPARAEYIGVAGTHHLPRAATSVAVTAYVCQDIVWDTQRRRVQL